MTGSWRTARRRSLPSASSATSASRLPPSRPRPGKGWCAGVTYARTYNQRHVCALGRTLDGASPRATLPRPVGGACRRRTVCPRRYDEPVLADGERRSPVRAFGEARRGRLSASGAVQRTRMPKNDHRERSRACPAAQVVAVRCVEDGGRQPRRRERGDERQDPPGQRPHRQVHERRQHHAGHRRLQKPQQIPHGVEEPAVQRLAGGGDGPVGAHLANARTPGRQPPGASE